MQMTEAVLLRIFVGEDDHAQGHSLHRLIVERARSARLAGATVLPGPVGFGPSGRVRSDMNVDAGTRSPIVIEIIDEEASIMAFLRDLDGLIDTGLVTIEKVRAWRPA